MNYYYILRYLRLSILMRKIPRQLKHHLNRIIKVRVKKSRILKL